MNENRHARPIERLDRFMATESLDALTGRTPRMATGFDPLDDVLEGGFRPEELIVLGGRPGVGKTITLVQWARDMAKAGNEVVLAHYEHSELALFAHLLLLEIGERVSNSSESIHSRAAISELLSGHSRWSDVATSDSQVREANSAVAEYASRLLVLTTTGLRGGMSALAEAVEHNPDASVLVVDHLHKVDPHRSSAAEVIEELKRLAVELGVTVLAAAMLETEAVGARRLRMSHLEAAAPVGHEADLVMMLNEKLPAVSRSHSAYDSVRANEFRNQLLLSIEKNRRGQANVDLEFDRDYAHRRIDPHGGFVSELLVDEVLVRE